MQQALARYAGAVRRLLSRTERVTLVVFHEFAVAACGRGRNRFLLALGRSLRQRGSAPLPRAGPRARSRRPRGDGTVFSGCTSVVRHGRRGVGFGPFEAGRSRSRIYAANCELGALRIFAEVRTVASPSSSCRTTSGERGLRYQLGRYPGRANSPLYVDASPNRLILARPSHRPTYDSVTNTQRQGASDVQAHTKHPALPPGAPEM
jgi:hypothetical protein